MFDEMNAAQRLGLAPAEIQNMVTTQAARILRIRTSRKDWIAVRGSLLGNRPEMVVINGRIRLLAGRLAERYADDTFQPVETRDAGTVFVRGRMP
jgi:hypothetical protein